MSNNILIYTFRTFPWMERLKSISEDVVILGKLKEDIKKVENILLSDKYSLVLGIAKSENNSLFESKGVNQFNRNKIVKDGKDSYTLNYPSNGFNNIKINDSFTTSFCNWSIYQIARFIEIENLKVDHSFVHIKESDIVLLESYIKRYS